MIKSKNHIGFFRVAEGPVFELFTGSDGDIYRAALSNCIDLDTGNRFGCFELPRRYLKRSFTEYYGDDLMTVFYGIWT